MRGWGAHATRSLLRRSLVACALACLLSAHSLASEVQEDAPYAGEVRPEGVFEVVVATPFAAYERVLWRVVPLAPGTWMISAEIVWRGSDRRMRPTRLLQEEEATALWRAGAACQPQRSGAVAEGHTPSDEGSGTLRWSDGVVSHELPLEDLSVEPCWGPWLDLWAELGAVLSVEAHPVWTEGEVGHLRWRASEPTLVQVGPWVFVPRDNQGTLVLSAGRYPVRWRESDGELREEVVSIEAGRRVLMHLQVAPPSLAGGGASVDLGR